MLFEDSLGVANAGIGLEGNAAQEVKHLGAAAPPEFVDPLRPTWRELRRRAIWNNWRGIADLAPMKKHVFALRLGQIREGHAVGHGYSKIVVLGANNEGDSEKTEQVFGDYAWWKPVSDGKQIIHFKIEWKDGIASLYLPDGSKQTCRTKGQRGNEVRISGLRYAWLGGLDEELKLTFPGMRFLRARLVDLDKQR